MELKNEVKMPTDHITSIVLEKSENCYYCKKGVLKFVSRPDCETSSQKLTICNQSFPIVVQFCSNLGNSVAGEKSFMDSGCPYTLICP
ncbi:unnamed protein product [Onchocerca flexuosa]|uniref:UPAR/Ly6 domain-containing protein n=1 Tax=Onchocerca flexuosa TaxID=387005 RepID=A0A183H088_9BILA|nr:unnamed protein product [Onchocerca flexuosa]